VSRGDAIMALVVYIAVIIYGIISGRYGVSIVMAWYLMFVLLFPGLVCLVLGLFSKWFKRKD
jgi:hypothetical protein